MGRGAVAERWFNANPITKAKAIDLSSKFDRQPVTKAEAVRLIDGVTP